MNHLSSYDSMPVPKRPESFDCEGRLGATDFLIGVHQDNWTEHGLNVHLVDDPESKNDLNKT